MPVHRPSPLTLRPGARRGQSPHLNGPYESGVAPRRESLGPTVGDVTGCTLGPVRSKDEKTADEVSALLVDVAERIVIPRFGALAAEDVQEKRPGDLVTVADRESEAEISRALSLLSPRALVVGEEQVFTDPGALDGLAGAEEAWVIDPIDGTKNFTLTVPNFAIMVAHVREGETVEAWIYQPMYDAMYRAEKGAGVRRNGVSVVRRTDRARPLGAAYVRLDPPPRGVDLCRRWSSCGIDYPKLVEGEIDFLLYREGKPWDHLPGALMVCEQGGRSATRAGLDYRPGTMDAPLSVIPSDQWERVREALAGTS